ncbi:hypothetical protein NC652_021139 [Populus alba x Populus x berolinensis]|nr:hypothetical protein NC652_021139 [Populus alba x Populus x berolinensis]
MPDVITGAAFMDDAVACESTPRHIRSTDDPRVATIPVADDALAGHCGPIELSIKTGPLEILGAADQSGHHPSHTSSPYLLKPPVMKSWLAISTHHAEHSISLLLLISFLLAQDFKVGPAMVASVKFGP